MKISRNLVRVTMLVVVASRSLLTPAALPARRPVSLPKEIEWTWEVRPPHPDPKLPNVLLLGDSLSRNYFPRVTKDLSGVANVYLMASSISVGDPRLPREIREFAALEHVPFRIVHFNNGMHGWGCTEAQFEAAFPDFLQAVRSLVAGNRDLIWATITPVQTNAFNGATNERINARNVIARDFVTAAHITIDDQHALMMQHRDLYQDTVHFNSTGSDLWATRRRLHYVYSLPSSC